MSAPTTEYVGRFAPSPTGPLHFGSLIAALGSYAAARAAGGRWYLRIDDLDPPRQPAGAVDHIQRQLEAFGFEWDRAVALQSTRGADYADALQRLRAAGAIYPCSCSRKEVAASAPRGLLGPVYPGFCRAGVVHARREPAWRLRLPPGSLRFLDAVHGEYTRQAALELGDPVLRRRDGRWAYHLATAVDDAALGVTDVVRGADLLPATLIQRALQSRLDLPPLRWAHLPLARASSGDKLSKQTGARPLDSAHPLPALCAAWRLLGQVEPPAALASVGEFHDWARAQWSLARVPAETEHAHASAPKP